MKDTKDDKEIFFWANSGYSSAPKKKKSISSFVTTLLSNMAFYGGLVVALLCLFTVTQNNSKDIALFDYHFYNVLTTSMQSEIPRGSLVVVEKVDLNTVEVGDDITFYKNATASVTHRVVDITENYNDSGARGFKTKGVDNLSPDNDITYAVNVVGIVKQHIPYLGAILNYIANHLLLVCGIFGLLLLFFTLLRIALSPEKEVIEIKNQKHPPKVTQYTE